MSNNIEQLKKSLRAGKTRFIYTKKDGTEREAYGTTNLDIVPDNAHPKGVAIDFPDDIIRYYDIDKEGWRSFREENFVDMIG